MTISLSLLGGAGWQFLDNSGNVLTGGLLYTYAAGTTTPLTTYTSLTGLTANSNPIVLDSAGRVPYQIWLTDGSAYKFVLQTSASVQIGAWDNVVTTGLNSISFGTTGLTPATATQGVVTVAGTLNVANGGTGLTSLTAGRIPFGNGTAALDNSANLTYTTGTSTFSAPIISAATSMANAGNMVFSGSAARIQGDFSNATVANRTAFQDKTTNNNTDMYVLPNGTSNQSGFFAWANSDPTNSSYIGIGMGGGYARLQSGASGSGTNLPLGFAVANAERARIDTAGNFLIGSVTSTVGYDGASWKWVGYQAISRNVTIDTNHIVFYNPNGLCGFINTVGTSTIYGSVSDYRLKENVQPMTGALAKVLALNPVTYTWKKDGSPGQGFIAHELQAVIPEAATGTKDDVDDKGNPRYQGMDASHVVATLVAAVKELTARVAALEAK